MCRRDGSARGRMSGLTCAATIRSTCRPTQWATFPFVRRRGPAGADRRLHRRRQPADPGHRQDRPRAAGAPARDPARAARQLLSRRAAAPSARQRHGRLAPPAGRRSRLPPGRCAMPVPSLCLSGHQHRFQFAQTSGPDGPIPFRRPVGLAAERSADRYGGYLVHTISPEAPGRSRSRRGATMPGSAAAAADFAVRVTRRRRWRAAVAGAQGSYWRRRLPFRYEARSRIAPGSAVLARGVAGRRCVPVR